MQHFSIFVIIGVMCRCRTQLITVFQSVIDANERLLQFDSAKRQVSRCNHLIKYSHWLCTEMLLPHAPSQHCVLLTEAARERTRSERAAILQRWKPDQSAFTAISGEPFSLQVSSSIKECKALLKDLERLSSRTVADRNVYSWFCV